MSTILVPSVDAPLRVLALAGSLRRESYNRRLLEAAAELVPAGVRVEVFGALARVPLFSEDGEASGEGLEGVAELRARVAEADGVLVATPEYNQSMPGVLKNALDWLSRAAPEPVLAGRPAAVVGATPGPWGTRLAQAAVRQTLLGMGAAVLPGPAVYVRGAAEVFDPAGRLTDERTRAAVARMMAAFAEWMGRVAPRAAAAR